MNKYMRLVIGFTGGTMFSSIFYNFGNVLSPIINGILFGLLYYGLSDEYKDKQKGGGE